MTPTRDQVEEWKSCNTLDEALALAFAAGQSCGDGSGAELVREIKARLEHDPPGQEAPCSACALLDRLRAALLDGDAAREDAERLDWLDQQGGAIGDQGYGEYRLYFGDVFESVRVVIDRAREGSDA